MNVFFQVNGTSRFKALFVFFMFSVCLSGCGSSDKSEPAAVIEDDFSKLSLSIEERELRAAAVQVKFEKLAPEGWRLIEFSHVRPRSQAGYYDIDISAQLPEPLDKVIISATITLNASDLYRDSIMGGVIGDSYRNEDPEDIEKVARRYPDFDGYRKVVAAESRGYNILYKEEIRSVSYQDKENGIYCKGLIVGQFRCIWGNPKQQYSMTFYSQDIAIILPYISSLAKGN